MKRLMIIRPMIGIAGAFLIVEIVGAINDQAILAYGGFGGVMLMLLLALGLTIFKRGTQP